MKKFSAYALLLSLGVFSIGCEAETETAPATTTPPADTATDKPAGEGA